MNKGIVWCPHCGHPHMLGDAFCRTTGKPLEQQIHRTEGLPVRKHPLIGTIVDGRFEIVRRIGAGGMGEVFEARNRMLQREVAIKIVSQSSEEACARLYREAQLIASIQHPNICDVYDVGVMPDGRPYLVLERLKGETLDALLRRQQRLSPARAIELFTQILSGLECAHARGIVHRDLKPANVFLVDRAGLPPLAKVLDFGLAKDVSGRLRTMTRPGQTCGTVAYMSPEQLSAKPLDIRSDLFSLGIMLFETLSGRHPFIGPTVAETGMKILREPPTDWCKLEPRVPRALASLVHHALEKDAARRPQSAVAMQTALAAIDDPDDTDYADSLGLPRIAPSTSPSH